MRKYISIFTIIMVLMPFSQSVTALAISDVELDSSLNQLLNARIYLLAATENELKNLKVDVSMIDKIGNQRIVVLEHEILENETGHYISITTMDAIREPILNFELELNWTEGRLIREFTLIIDPQ